MDSERKCGPAGTTKLRYTPAREFLAEYDRTVGGAAPPPRNPPRGPAGLLAGAGGWTTLCRVFPFLSNPFRAPVRVLTLKVVNLYRPSFFPAIAANELNTSFPNTYSHCHSSALK